MDGFQSALFFAGDAWAAVREPAVQGAGASFLAGIFGLAGVAKLRHPTQAALAMAHFGVARRLRPRLAAAVGAAEVILASALALQIAPGPTASFASGLLWFFAFLIARSLWRGDRFACFCFGDGDSQLSKWTFARTVGLALLAVALASRARVGHVSFSLDKNDALEASVGLALLGTMAILSQVGRLVRWNSGPTQTSLAAE